MQKSFTFSGRASNPTKKKASPAQLAARKKFAEMARSGAFKKAKRAADRAKNPMNMYTVLHRGTSNIAGQIMASSPKQAKEKIAEKLGLASTAYLMATKSSQVRINPSKRKKTVSQKISQLMHEGYPQKQAVAVALSEQRAGKVKSNPISETLIYGLPKGENRDYMEELLYDGGQLLTEAQIKKIFNAASAQGWHSFRVVGFDPSVPPNFIKAISSGKKTTRKNPIKRSSSRSAVVPNPQAKSTKSQSFSNWKYSVEAKRMIPGGHVFEPIAGFATKVQAQDYVNAILASHKNVTLRIKAYK